ncbi:hypothetical protein G9C85_15910 [Halorubellus sp. JP-L1]|nr:hypothetical protein [Halorubellus sp. JP-L1]NHN43103.1 hypothetical protein [Halorubellus sp. JP-L1]
MFDRLRAVFRAPGTGFAECRRCGSNVDDPTAGCATCGSTEVAEYDL